MITIVIRFTGFLIGVALFPAALAFAYQAALFLVYESDSQMQGVALGFLAYVALFIFVVALGGFASIRFLQTFEHELIHAVLTKLFFWRVLSIAVSGDGGLTTASGSNNITIIGPYFFPLFTIPLLIFYPFAPEGLLPVLDVLIGFTLAFHFVGLLTEFRLYQPDLHMAGLPWALNLTLFFNALLVVLVFAVVQNDWGLFTDYIEASVESAQEFYAIILGYIDRIL